MYLTVLPKFRSSLHVLRFYFIFNCLPDKTYFIGTDCNSELPFIADSFDFVVSDNVFEHAGNLQLLVKDLYRVLIPGGMVVLQWFPNWSGPRGHHMHNDMVASHGTHRYKNNMAFIPPWGHLLYNKTELRVILQQSKAFESEKVLEIILKYIYDRNDLNRKMIDDIFEIILKFSWKLIIDMHCSRAFHRGEYVAEIRKLKTMYGERRMFNIEKCYVTLVK